MQWTGKLFLPTKDIYILYFVYCKETAIEPLNHQLTSSSNYHKTWLYLSWNDFQISLSKTPTTKFSIHMYTCIGCLHYTVDITDNQILCVINKLINNISKKRN